MTIRTDTDLDQQILDVLEADRAHLDRFAMTPNRHLLGALVGPVASAAGLWSLATTKLLTFAAAAAVIGSAFYFVARPAAVAPIVNAPRQVTSVPLQQAPVESAQQGPASATNEKALARHRSMNAPKPDAAASPTANAGSVQTKATDIDHWNTGDPLQVQLPTKLEIETKAK
jgi:hypothetical protein